MAFIDFRCSYITGLDATDMGEYLFGYATSLIEWAEEHDLLMDADFIPIPPQCNKEPVRHLMDSEHLDASTRFHFRPRITHTVTGTDSSPASDWFSMLNVRGQRRSICENPVPKPSIGMTTMPPRRRCAFTRAKSSSILVQFLS